VNTLHCHGPLVHTVRVSAHAQVALTFAPYVDVVSRLRAILPFADARQAVRVRGSVPGRRGVRRNVTFVVSGVGKADRVAEVLEGPQLPNQLPAQSIAPVRGQLTWLLDQPADSRLGTGRAAVE